MTKPRSLAAFIVLHAVALLALGGFSWSQHRLQPLADIDLPPDGRIACVSYAPHHKAGQAPFNPDFHASYEQVEQDLTALSHRFGCIRTYSISQGLDQVPAIARKLGMKVILGAWINADPVDTNKELTAAIRLANDNTDVVRALIVGNEVMLRREQTQTGMLRLLKQAKAEAKVPITYADVWEFWEKNLPLADEVDFATIHILPYWEDKPVAIDDAVEHVSAVVEHMKPLFKKPLLIGETGWPSLGRQREGALPSPVNQARYVREFVTRANQRGWDYNLIEAIDQPWKRRLEGTVGGYWGMLSADTLEEKFSLRGPMANRNDSTFHWTMGIGGALLGWLAVLAARRSLPGVTASLASALLGAFTGLTLAFQWQHMRDAYPGSLQLGIVSSIVIAAALAIGRARPELLNRAVRTALAAVVLVLALFMVASGSTARDRFETTSLCLVTLLTLATTALVARAIGSTRDYDGNWLRLSEAVRFAVLFSAGVGSLLIWADSRYRDFPYLLYLVPALEFALAWQLLGERSGLRAISREEKLLAVMIGSTCIARLLPEPMNPQAIGWTLLGLLLAWIGLARRPA
ncbi:hypothetical protein BH10PSE17_BH10PSE17_17410 [soil metagenome]